MMGGHQHGEGVLSLVEEMLPEDLTSTLYADSRSAISSSTTDCGAWRRRHLQLRAHGGHMAGTWPSIKHESGWNRMGCSSHAWHLLGSGRVDKSRSRTSVTQTFAVPGKLALSSLWSIRKPFCTLHGRAASVQEGDYCCTCAGGDCSIGGNEDKVLILAALAGAFTLSAYYLKGDGHHGSDRAQDHCSALQKLRSCCCSILWAG